MGSTQINGNLAGRLLEVERPNELVSRTEEYHTHYVVCSPITSLVQFGVDHNITTNFVRKKHCGQQDTRQHPISQIVGEDYHHDGGHHHDVSGERKLWQIAQRFPIESAN